MSRTEPDEQRVSAPLWALLFAVCALITGGLGVAKLIEQRDHPPAYFQKPAHQYEGYVAIDDYGRRAGGARDVLAGEPGAAAEFRQMLLEGLHPATFLIPFAVGATALVTGSVVWSFAGLAFLASLGTALLAGRLARRIWPGGGAAVFWLAACLTIGHLLTVRTSAQILMDPFCSLWTLGFVGLLMRWRERPGRGQELAMVALLITGLWIKISLAPLCGLPFLVRLLGGPRRPLELARTIAVFCGIPVLAWLATLYAIGAFDRILVDAEDQFSQFNYTGNFMGRFGQEMVLLFQVAPLLLLLRAPKAQERAAARTVALTLAVILLATWGFKFPPIARLYLPLVGLQAVIVAPRLVASVKAPVLITLVTLWLAVNYALAAWLTYG